MSFSKSNNYQNLPDLSSIWCSEFEGDPSFNTILPERHRQKMRSKGNRGHHHECFEENVDRRINKLEHSNRVLRSDLRNCKKTIESLKNSLRKNETILREIHHRMKNHLQLVSNLLLLEEGKCGSPEFMEALRQSRACIRLIAKFHDTLYMTRSFDSINFVEYVRTIADSLSTLYGRDAISFSVSACREPLEKDKALYLGLIINEILTNSFKYAFPEEAAGSISIDLRKTGARRFTLTIRDNGRGLPESMDSNNSSSGLKIVQCMVSQLEGTLDFRNEKGTMVIITFPDR